MFSCLKDHLGCAVECLRCGFDGEFSWKSDEDACIRQSVNDNECISRACSREHAQFVELSFCDDGSLPQCGEDFFCRLYEFIRCLLPWRYGCHAFADGSRCVWHDADDFRIRKSFFKGFQSNGRCDGNDFLRMMRTEFFQDGRNDVRLDGNKDKIGRFCLLEVMADLCPVLFCLCSGSFFAVFPHADFFFFPYVMGKAPGEDRSSHGAAPDNDNFLHPCGPFHIGMSDTGMNVSLSTRTVSGVIIKTLSFRSSISPCVR